MKLGFAALFTLVLAATPGYAATPAELKLVGDWDVLVTVKERHALASTLHVAPPTVVAVTAEKYDSLPPYDAKAAGWVKGVQLKVVRVQATTTPHLFDPACRWP